MSNPTENEKRRPAPRVVQQPEQHVDTTPYAALVAVPCRAADVWLEGRYLKVFLDIHREVVRGFATTYYAGWMRVRSQTWRYRCWTDHADVILD